MDSLLDLFDIFLGTKKEENNKYKSNLLELRKLKTRIIKNVDDAINIEEIERLAYSKLDMNALSYYMSGANSEHTLKRNINYFHKIMIYPRVLVDVSKVDLKCTILGREVDSPILIAPTALHKLAHPDGELATAQAANEKNTLICLSSLSSNSMEKVAKANQNGMRWFQLYVMKSREETINMVKEAERNGFSAIVVTVDAPILGYRERDFQVKFKIPEGVDYENLKFLNKNNITTNDKDIGKVLTDSGSKSQIFSFFASNIDDSLTWDIIPWLKQNTKLHVVIKGIHRVDDALKAREMGADAIIVSNHGARQLDKVPSTIEMLYPICQALSKIEGNKMEVYVDGGIRRGTDVFKAIAMGAKAVFIGRPVLFGLAADGKNGVCKVLDLLRNELLMTMKLSGCIDLKKITGDYIKIRRALSKF
jgi:(S)-2-hydroxy-acid oxidase